MKKTFLPEVIETADPKFSFAGGIRVGSTLNSLEKFLGVKVNQISTERGLILFDITNPNVSIVGENLSIFHDGSRLQK